MQKDLATYFMLTDAPLIRWADYIPLLFLVGLHLLIHLFLVGFIISYGGPVLLLIAGV
jgi:hypothetical protein